MSGTDGTVHAAQNRRLGTVSQPVGMKLVQNVAGPQADGGRPPSRGQTNLSQCAFGRVDRSVCPRFSTPASEAWNLWWQVNTRNEFFKDSVNDRWQPSARPERDHASAWYHTPFPRTVVPNRGQTDLSTRRKRQRLGTDSSVPGLEHICPQVFRPRLRELTAANMSRCPYASSPPSTN